MSKRRRRLAGELARFRRNYGKKSGAELRPDPEARRNIHKFDKRLRRMNPEEFDDLLFGDGLDYRPEDRSGEPAEG